MRTAQLNHEMLYTELDRSTNQVFTLALGRRERRQAEGARPRAPADLRSLADESAPLEARVRSYWASNCSMCHGSVPDILADWDTLYEVPLEGQGIIYGPSQSVADDNAFLVVPSDPDDSVLFQRSSITARGLGMPPLGRSTPDPAYVQVLER